MLPSLVSAQRLFVGLTGKDTVLPAGKISVRYRAPAGWQRDTFLLVVRNALGIVRRSWLLPHSTGLHQAEVTLSKPGFFIVLVLHPRMGGRIWATHRLYVLAPPCTTIAQARAYHNALVERKLNPDQTMSVALPEEIEPLHEPFPDIPPLPITELDVDSDTVEPSFEEPTFLPEETFSPDE
ncbi:MAG: hypothetical protein ABDH66_05280 [Bacteroidia bacterium]